ncbi:MAG TPA: T9SS type A sorting domain-containing protein [Chitinophagaceae bacterium]|jgi:hypothetical protein
MKHKYLILFFLTGIYTNTFSQPTMVHQKAIGGKFVDILSSLDVTKDGGLIAGGYSDSHISGEKTQNTNGYDDYWVVKLDKFRNIQWDKTIGGSNTDILYGIQQTRDGGYILGGLSFSNKSGDKTQHSRGDDDFWVVKLDGLGNIQWDKTIGGNRSDDVSSLQQTDDGGYIVGGSSYSNKSGEKSEGSRGDLDYWVVKLDSSGNVQWDKTLGGNDYDYLTSLQQTRDGGYIVGGTSYSNRSGDKGQKSRGSADYWVIKLDKLGNIKWDKTVGGEGEDILRSLQQTRDGGFILGGRSDSDISGEKTEKNRDSLYDTEDYWVVKLDNSGRVVWDKTVGGSSFDYLYSLQQTSDGGYILGGFSESNKSGEKTEDNRNPFYPPTNDYWVVKLNKNGHVEWDKTIGGLNDDKLFVVKELRRNYYVLGGGSFSGVTADRKVKSRGSSDYWLVWLKYNSPAVPIATTAGNENSTVQSNKNKTREFIAYPNPAKDILHIQTNSKTMVALTDQAGEILLTQIVEGNGIINISKLAPGIYYLKNRTTGEVQKIFVAK